MTTWMLAFAFAIQTTTYLRVVSEGLDSPIREHLEITVRTPAEWHALSSRLAPGVSFEPIDLAHEMVLAVFAGAGPFSGYRVDIFSVVREGGSIVARYRREPVGNRTTPNAAPYQIVAVPRDQRKVRFIEARETGARRRD